MSERAEALIRQLEDFARRSSAKRELIRLGDEAVEPLIAALSTRIRPVRWSVISTLEAIGDDRAVAPLVDLLEQGVPEQAAVLAALASITGEDHGADLGKWRALAKGAPGTIRAQAAETPNAELVCAALSNTGIAVEADNDRASCFVELPNGRHQVIKVLPGKGPDGEELIAFYTECGPADPSRYEWALRKNLSLAFGKYAIRKVDGTSMFVMVYAMRKEDAHPTAVREIVRTLAEKGDRLERYLREEDIA